MDFEKREAIIEAILFSAGRVVDISEIAKTFELTVEDAEKVMENMRNKYENRGIELIKVDGGYQLSTKKEYYDYIYPIFDNRVAPSLSNAALETLSIIAYNPRITRAEIESIRGVNSDGTIYRLLDYNLIEDAGKSDAPGRPTTYRTTKEFLKMFGLSSLDQLPELPKYRIDENEQIVIDDLIDNEKSEAPNPERVTVKENDNEEKNRKDD